MIFPVAAELAAVVYFGVWFVVAGQVVAASAIALFVVAEQVVAVTRVRSIEVVSEVEISAEVDPLCPIVCV